MYHLSVSRPVKSKLYVSYASSELDERRRPKDNNRGLKL